jgi:hypothetical protein
MAVTAPGTGTPVQLADAGTPTTIERAPGRWITRLVAGLRTTHPGRRVVAARTRWREGSTTTACTAVVSTP